MNFRTTFHFMHLGNRRPAPECVPARRFVKTKSKESEITPSSKDKGFLSDTAVSSGVLGVGCYIIFSGIKARQSKDGPKTSRHPNNYSGTVGGKYRLGQIRIDRELMQR